MIPSSEYRQVYCVQESGEMYLENILILSKEKEGVHAIDIVNRMGFSKPSVSIALSKLKANGYITVDSDDHIALTDAGRITAEKIYERHLILTEMLERLGVSTETAIQDACKIEHDISDESLEAIKRQLTNLKIIKN